MSSNVSINLYLRPCSTAIYGKFYLYCLYHPRLFWSVNIENLVCKLCISVKMHKHCLYWNIFSTDINGKIIFNCLLLFKPFLLVSKLYESVNFTSFFRHAQKLRQGEYLIDFSIVSYGKFNSSFPVLFLAFFIWSLNCSSYFFSSFLLVSKLYKLNL